MKVPNEWLGQIVQRGAYTLYTRIETGAPQNWHSHVEAMQEVLPQYKSNLHAIP